MATLMSYFAPPIAGEWGDEAEDNTDGVPVLRTTNFTADGRLSYDDLTYRSIDTEKKENKILQLGDIIIEKSGGTPKKPVGRCVYFDRDDEYDYFCSNFTAILRANTEEVNTKYLWYILQEHYKTRQCLKYQYKTNGIANLDIKDYLNHKEVELPPKEVQDKRVKAMDYSQYLLDLHQELLDIMDNAVKSRFIEMFGGNKYPVQKIGNVAKLQGGYAFKSKDYIDGGIPLVQITNVSKSTLIWEEYNCVPTEYLERYEDFCLQAGDIVMAMTRPVIKSLDAVKVAMLNDNDTPCLLNQRVGRFKIDTDQLNPIYLMTICQMAEFKQYVELMSGNSLQPNISSKQVEDYEIILPPLDVQNQFAAFVALTDKSKLTIQKSMDNLQELRDSLLQEYFG